MCRIAGIIQKGQSYPYFQEELSLALDAQHHGGPDDRGLHIADHWGFAHNRLSIIDTSANGHQPMVESSTQNVISYNGEVYNFRELRESLISYGHQFSSNTDTEVILKAYQQWGEKSFSMLNGIFAFSLYDHQQQLIYLVRDPQGVKPLYFSNHSEQLRFSSELQHPFWKASRPSSKCSILLLAYGFIPEPFTKYEQVFALPASSFLKCELANGQVSSHSYQYESLASSTDLQTELQLAVNRQLVSDVRIGTFLSGGLDSSILTLLSSFENNKTETLSVYFEERDLSEQSFQNAMVAKTKSKHHAFCLNEKQFHQHTEEILNAYYSPSNDGVNAWFISKYAKQSGLKVMLSGLGADELFGGYPSFTRINQLLWLKKFKLLSPLLRNIKPEYNRLEYLQLDGSCQDYLILRGFFAPTEISSILNLSKKEVFDILRNHHASGVKNVTTVRDMADVEMHVYMKNQLLRDVDAMSMQHGVEVRVPFLDNDFVNFVQKLDDDIRFNNPGSKSILRAAFMNKLPTEISSRAKHGFVLPFQKWMKNSEFLKAKVGSHPYYQKFLNDQMHWSKLWVLAQIEL